AEVTLLAPIRRPGTVWAIGLNYRKHAEEAGATLPERPLLFLKAAPSVTGPSGPVIHPKATTELDYEGELALVLGAGPAERGDALDARQGRRPLLPVRPLDHFRRGDRRPREPPATHLGERR